MSTFPLYLRPRAVRNPDRVQSPWFWLTSRSDVQVVRMTYRYLRRGGLSRQAARRLTLLTIDTPVVR